METIKFCPKCGRDEFSQSPPQARQQSVGASSPRHNNSSSQNRNTQASSSAMPRKISYGHYFSAHQFVGIAAFCLLLLGVSLLLFINNKKPFNLEANNFRNPSGSSVMSVPMLIEGGVYKVPVLINGTIRLDFVVDSGASDVSIPADVVMTLMRTGTLKNSDFLGEKTYILADGSEAPSQTFRIRSLKVGNKVLENVIGSVAPEKGLILLGQSFLGRFKSWSIDNNKHALVLE